MIRKSFFLIVVAVSAVRAQESADPNASAIQEMQETTVVPESQTALADTALSEPPSQGSEESILAQTAILQEDPTQEKVTDSVSASVEASEVTAPAETQISEKEKSLTLEPDATVFDPTIVEAKTAVPVAENPPATPEPPLATEQPEASEQDTIAEAEDNEEEPLDPIDTVNIEEPKGNWLNKRIYWERAETEYEKISQQTQEIATMSPHYYQQRAELNRSDLDKFYITEGIELGELKQIIATSIEGLEEERTRKGSLTEEGRLLTDKLQEQQILLKKMDQKISTVSAIDSALDEDLSMLDRQISQARAYERQAWAAFKAISRELSDKKARAIYYSMKALKKNVRSIYTYLNGPLDEHFKQLISTARNRIGEIKDAMERLRSEGIDLKAYAKKLTQPESCPKLEEEPQEEELQQPTSWLGNFWNSITSTISDLWQGGLSLIGY